MITKITGETPFQVLTNNFSISPSNEGYTLQISADGVNFSNLFSVGANVTRLVTGVAANSYYRLLGNESAVQINWMKTCVTEGGSGGSGATYTAGDYIDITQDVISVTGITPDLYLTSADTEDFLTSADTENLVSSAQVQSQIDASVSGKADAANVTANKSTMYFPKWNNQGIITGEITTTRPKYLYINGVSKEVLGDGSFNNTLANIYAPVSAGTAGDILVSTGNGAPVWSAVTMPDMSAYYTSAITEEKIASAVTPVANHLAEVEQVTASAYTELHDGLMEVSARTVDLSGYYTSAQTVSAIATALTAYTPTTGFATVNGSALTNGGNIVIEGGGDLSNYWDSAETQSHIEAATENKVGSSNESIFDIIKISDMDYMRLKNNDEIEDTTLYVIVATPDISRYLTFEVTDVSDGGEIGWNDNDGIQYDLNYDENWQTLDVDNSIYDLQVGDIIRFKGNRAKYGDEYGDGHKFDGDNTTAKVKIYGNIMSLMYEDCFRGQYEFPEEYGEPQTDQFKGLFRGLDTGGKIASVEGLVLPVSSVTDRCYKELFDNYHGTKINLICLAEDNLTANEWCNDWLNPDTSGCKFYKSSNVSQQDFEDYFNLNGGAWTLEDYTGEMPTVDPDCQ